MHAYNPLDTFPETVPVLDDGDEPEAASWAPSIEAVANMAKWLKNRIPGGNLAYVPVPLAPADRGLSTDRFKFQQITNVGLGQVQVDVTDQGALFWGLDLPAIAEIDQVRATLCCDSQGSLPAGGGMPILGFMRENISTKVSPTVYTQVDTSADIATFNAVHVITLDLPTVQIYAQDDPALNVFRFYVFFNGQSGGGATNGKLILKDIRIRVKAIAF